MDTACCLEIDEACLSVSSFIFHAPPRLVQWVVGGSAHQIGKKVIGQPL